MAGNKKPGLLVRSPGEVSWGYQLGSGTVSPARRVSHRRMMLWARLSALRGLQTRALALAVMGVTPCGLKNALMATKHRPLTHRSHDNVLPEVKESENQFGNSANFRTTQNE
jgi:hypothetical protein